MPFPSSRPFRKKANWLLALGVEAGAPLLRAYARTRTGPGRHPREWRKALIIGDNHIGDLLYRSASLEHLKKGFPDCELHYLAAPGPHVILEGNPALASVLPWVKSDSPLDLSPEHFAQLAAMKFDAALCTNSIKYWPELLLALRLGIPNRAAYVFKGFSGWTTLPIQIQYPRPYPDYFRDYAATLTSQRPGWPARPVIHPNERDEIEAEAVWTSLNVTKPALACFLTTRQPTPIWPAAKFGETLRILRKKRDIQILLCGTESDEPILSGVNRDFDLNAHVVAGRLGIRALYCFLRRCAAALTTDSGPRHIANAAGIPVAFVRNVWSNAAETGKYLDSEIDLCGLPDDGDRGSNPATLLAAIDPEAAAAAVAAILPA